MSNISYGKVQRGGIVILSASPLGTANLPNMVLEMKARYSLSLFSASMPAFFQPATVTSMASM